jgi:alpha-beta hydrolase superfamily lysophospholipase
MAPADINLTPTATCFEIEATKADPNRSPTTYRLQARSWGNPNDCQSAILLVHGLGAHSGWFEALARRLKVRNLFVLSYDQAGFGKRRNERFKSSKQWLEDLTVAFKYLESLVADKPVFLAGNSMGAVVSLSTATTLHPAGLVLLTPGFAGHPRTFTPAYKITTLVKAGLNPEKDFDLPYGLELVSELESVRAWLENDPDRRFSVPGRMLTELLSLTQKLKAKKSVLECPAIMLTAGRDRIVDNKVNKQIFKKLVSRSKESRDFSDSIHDLTLNVVVEQVADELTNWMQTCEPGKVAANPQRT